MSGGAISWRSVKQFILLTKFTTEAEYVVAYEGRKEIVWIRKFLMHLCVVRLA
jgi:hypothetical protein